MATSSFFYGGATAPEQNTVNELIAELETLLALAREASNAAVQAAANASAAADSASVSVGTVSALANQAIAAAADANAAKAAAENVLAQVQAIQAAVQLSADSAEAAQVAALLAASQAEASKTLAELAAANAQASADAAAASAEAAAAVASQVVGYSNSIYIIEADTTGLVLSAPYAVGYENVYRNGAKLVRNQDYFAWDGSEIQILFPVVAGDVFEVDVYGGFTGAAGAAASVSVGTTTTGAPGTSASVTNSGTSSAAVFNFTIPRGAGIVSGGTTNQVLKKASNTDYDVTWGTVDALPSQTGNSGKYLTTDGSTASWAVVTTGGDVAGPSSAVNNNLAVFDGTTGKLIKDGGVSASSFLTANNPSYSGTLTGGTGVVNLGSGQFYKDASGNVGVGTSSPATKFHVYGANYGSATIDAPAYPTLEFRSNGTGFGYVGAGQVSGGGAGDLGIRSGGNLQLAAGSTTANITLSLNNASTGSNWLFSGNGTKAYFDSTIGSSIGFRISGTQFGVIGSAANNLTGGSTTDVSIHANNNIHFATGGTALTNIRMWIASGGNVGVGTTSPSTKLEVSGVITATGGTSTDWNNSANLSKLCLMGL
jgi:hypothetical protein